MAEKLRTINNIDQYTILPKGLCRFSLSELSPDDQTNLRSDCKSLLSQDTETVLGQLFYSDKGVTLSTNWSTKEDLDVEVLIDQFVNLCDGLNIFIKNNIIHNDIKPENIIVTDDFTKPKFIDFWVNTNL